MFIIYAGHFLVCKHFVETMVIVIFFQVHGGFPSQEWLLHGCRATLGRLLSNRAHSLHHFARAEWFNLSSGQCLAVASAFALGAAEGGAAGRAFFLLRAGVEVRDSGSHRFVPIKRSRGGRLGQAVRGPGALRCAEHQQSHEFQIACPGPSRSLLFQMWLRSCSHFSWVPVAPMRSFRGFWDAFWLWFDGFGRGRLLKKRAILHNQTWSQTLVSKPEFRPNSRRKLVPSILYILSALWCNMKFRSNLIG